MPYFTVRIETLISNKDKQMHPVEKKTAPNQNFFIENPPFKWYKYMIHLYTFKIYIFLEANKLEIILILLLECRNRTKLRIILFKQTFKFMVYNGEEVKINNLK